MLEDQAARQKQVLARNFVTVHGAQAERFAPHLLADLGYQTLTDLQPDNLTEQQAQQSYGNEFVPGGNLQPQQQAQPQAAQQQQNAAVTAWITPNHEGTFLAFNLDGSSHPATEDEMVAYAQKQGSTESEATLRLRAKMLRNGRDLSLSTDNPQEASAQYALLEPGTEFIDPNGKKRRKP